MIEIRRADERGHSRLSWLNSFHSFSFADYHDPRYMGVSNLRVINDDTVAAGGGFATHGHRDMEIVTYVLEGALEHKDSMGNGSVIRPGDVQHMSAGTGVRHSEFNHSRSEPVHFLQIWLQPNRTGVQPGYNQRNFPSAERRGRLRLLVSPEGRDGSIPTQQDGLLYGALLAAEASASHRLPPGRMGYVHLARGCARVNDQELSAGDGLTLRDEAEITLSATDESEILAFDLPGA
ncbi:MAG: pirin family protein [Chromatiaceae bacterium]